MHSGTYLPSIDALSNEQSNLSTQQDYTYKMIKEVKQLKRKHFFKMKDLQTLTTSFRKSTSNTKSYNNNKHLLDLTTFHMNALRNSIHNKAHHDKPASTRIKLLLEQKNKPSEQCTINSDNMTLSSNNSHKKHQQSSTFAQTITTHNKKHNERYSKSSTNKYMKDHYYNNNNSRNTNNNSNSDKYCLTTYSHNQENCKSLNYYFGVYSSFKHETIYDYMEKNRNIRLTKIINHVIKDSYSKYKNDRINNMDLVQADIYNFSTGFDYLKTYADVSDKYFVFLNNEIQKQLQTLAYYKEKRITLMNEAHKINQRLNRVQVRFNSNFNNKFFLMCVKNETNQPHLFCEEDRLEYEKDMQKLQFLMNIGSIEITNPLKAEETRSLIEKEMEMFNKQNMQSLYFNSSEHFLLNVNKISSRVTLLMNEYNESQTVLKKLRNELEQTKFEIRNDEKNNLFWELEIDDKEKKLLEAKTKHAALLSYYNNLPQSNDMQIGKLLIEIHKHYNEIKYKTNYICRNENEFKNKKRKEIIRDRSSHSLAIEEMKFIENIVNYLLNLNKKWKKEQTKKFDVAKKEIEKIKRINATRILKEKEMIKMQNKMKEIIEKNDRLVVVPKKKVKEKYKMITLCDNDSKKEDVKKNNVYLETMQQCHNFLFE